MERIKLLNKLFPNRNKQDEYDARGGLHMKIVEENRDADTEAVRESPSYVRTSLAAAMTMSQIPGKFYRDAKLYCINILLT